MRWTISYGVSVSVESCLHFILECCAMWANQPASGYGPVALTGTRVTSVNPLSVWDTLGGDPCHPCHSLVGANQAIVSIYLS